MEEKIKSQVVNLCIPEYVASDKGVVFFKIVVTCNEKQWCAERRFSEFDSLHKELKKTFPTISSLPPKTILKLKSSEGLIKRRIDLNNFLQNLAARPEVLNHQSMLKFLRLCDNIPAAKSLGPVQVAELKDFPLGVRDFIYLESSNIFFIALSDMNITSRLDAYVNNLKLPWEKVHNSDVTVGALIVLHVDPHNGWKSKTLWVKSYGMQTNVLFWSKEHRLLALGMDDGIVHFFFMHIDSINTKCEKMFSLPLHGGRVMGIAVDPTKNLLFSVAEDKKLKIMDISQQKETFEMTVGTFPLKFLEYDEKNKRLFVLNGGGELFIFGQIEDQVKTIKILSLSIDVLRSAVLDEEKGNIIASAMDGTLAVVNPEAPGNETAAKVIKIIRGPEKSRCVQWRSHPSELLSGHENGAVIMWDLDHGAANYSFFPHRDAITKMHWDESNQYLYTCAKDKAIRIWRLPPYWYAFILQRSELPATGGGKGAEEEKEAPVDMIESESFKQLTLNPDSDEEL